VFETNNEHIFDAAAAIEVFDAFKADMLGLPRRPATGKHRSSVPSARRS
jgi:hypothetical protein